MADELGAIRLRRRIKGHLQRVHAVNSVIDWSRVVAVTQDMPRDVTLLIFDSGLELEVNAHHLEVIDLWREFKRKAAK